MSLKPPTAQAWTVALPNPPPLRATATSRERLSRGQREGLTGVEQRSTEQTGVGSRPVLAGEPCPLSSLSQALALNLEQRAGPSPRGQAWKLPCPSLACPAGSSLQGGCGCSWA